MPEGDEQERISIENAHIDLDWHKDEAMHRTSKWNGIVDFVDGHVEGYKLDRVLRGGFFRIKPPVFANPFVKWQAVFVIIMQFCWAGTLITLHNTETMLISPELVGQSAAIFDYFGALSGFLFGFFVFDNLANFVTVKNSYLGGFWGAFNELVVMMCYWVPGTSDDDKSFKEVVVRYGLAGFNLMCLHAAGSFTEAENVDICKSRNLLTEQEAAHVKEMGCHAATPVLWIFRLFENKLAGSRGDGFKLGKAEDKINAMRSGIGNVLTAISSYGLTPLPLVHLMSALVKIVSLK